MLDDRDLTHSAYLAHHGQISVDSPASAVLDLAEPDAWQRGDTLLLPMRAGDGCVLGVLSIDEPSDGERPSLERIEILGYMADCLLMPYEDVRARVPVHLHDRYFASHRAGHGPLAWNDHRLLVVLRDRDDEVTGTLWADDPADRLLPTPERLKAMRAFANDSLGHEGGDEVLRRFSKVLYDCTRETDMPTRLGGEEFAVVLAGVDAMIAMAVAERVRLAVRSEFATIRSRSRSRSASRPPTRRRATPPTSCARPIERCTPPSTSVATAACSTRTTRWTCSTGSRTRPRPARSSSTPRSSSPRRATCAMKAPVGTRRPSLS